MDEAPDHENISAPSSSTSQPPEDLSQTTPDEPSASTSGEQGKTADYRKPAPDATSDTSSSSGDELSVYSMKFDPKKALEAGQKMIPRLPFPKTRRLDNMSKYKLIINASDDPLQFETNMINVLKRKPLSRKSNKYVDPNEESKIERKFLPHQMPIFKPREELKLNNLLKRMSIVEGPLAKLREFKEKRIRLCIKTKNILGGLNELVAYVVAFDKHWNLALEDVTETFMRKKKRKVPICLGSEIKLSDEELAKRGLVKPVVLKSLGKKQELCTRHLPQLMLRGNYIVVIHPAI